MPADWPLLPNIAVPEHRPESVVRASIRHLGKNDHWGGTYSWWGIWEQGVWCNPSFGGPYIWLLGCQRKHGFSRLTPLDPPPLGWWLALPTSEVCLTGGPTQPQFVVLYQGFWWVTLPISSALAGHGYLLEIFQFQPLGRQWTYITSLQLHSGWMPLGFSVGPFTWGHLLLRVLKGHMSLPSMPARGPLMPIQRPTPVAAVAAGASTLDTVHFLAQSVNI